VAAIYLAVRGRGAATLSEAFNSNAINAIVGLMLPGAVLGLTRPSGDGLFVALSLVILTGACVGLALPGRGLDRRAGSLIIVGYLVFAAVLATG
jgi:Ca2+/Na+ antiporter